MTDPLAFIRAMADRITCAQIEREEGRRLILVPSAALAAQVEALAVVLGVDDIVAVQAAPLLPDGKAWVIDVGAIDAGTREAIQHGSRRLFDELWPP